MLSRRTLIGKAAAGAAAAVALGAARTAVGSARAPRAATDGSGDDRELQNAGLPPEASVSPPPGDAEAITSPPPWGLVSPLVAGAEVAHGWRLVDLSPVRDGACVARLENARGRSHRVHLCRNDGSPEGIVHTRRVDLVVMNEGHGDLPTEEGLAQAVAALGHAVAANERTAGEGVFAALLPHGERVRRFAAADHGKLR